MKTEDLIWRCPTCGGSEGNGFIHRGELGLTASEYYFFCGCKSHTWCPTCTPFYVRWLERLYLYFNPVS